MQLAAQGGKTVPTGGFISTMRSISQTEGITAMYSGLSAALTRQVTYTTLRLGLYSSLRERFSSGDAPPSLSVKFAAGIVSGAVASAISTPVEVSMVRMYNDGAADVSKRRGYRNIFDALYRIARDEGVSGLWRGATPTVVRSMVVNCVQLGTYDQAKEMCINRFQLRDGVGVHLAASTTSGFCYSVVTLPIDSAKTRLQNQHRLPDGSLPYRHLGHAIVRVSREEGILALWRGFIPYFSRCAGKFRDSIVLNFSNVHEHFFLTDASNTFVSLPSPKVTLLPCFWCSSR